MLLKGTSEYYAEVFMQRAALAKMAAGYEQPTKSRHSLRPTLDFFMTLLLSPPSDEFSQYSVLHFTTEDISYMIEAVSRSNGISDKAVLEVLVEQLIEVEVGGRLGKVGAHVRIVQAVLRMLERGKTDEKILTVLAKHSLRRVC